MDDSREGVEMIDPIYIFASFNGSNPLTLFTIGVVCCLYSRSGKLLRQLLKPLPIRRGGS